MSQDKPKKKKVVIKKKATDTVRPTKSKITTGKSRSSARAVEFPFSKNNFMFMGLGVLLIFLGMIAMSGGGMPDPETWDADRIYGFRRTVLAPVLILAGLAIEVYAIFKD